MIALAGSLLGGEFNADSLHSESNLYLRDGATINGKLELGSAKIDGEVSMRGASIHGTLDANALQVGGMVTASNLTRFDATQYNANDLY